MAQLPIRRIPHGQNDHRGAVRQSRDVHPRGDERAFGDASGTNGAFSIVRTAGGLERSFLKTVIPSDESGGQLNIESDRNAAFKGISMFGDAYYDVHIADTFAGVFFSNCAA